MARFNSYKKKYDDCGMLGKKKLTKAILFAVFAFLPVGVLLAGHIGTDGFKFFERLPDTQPRVWYYHHSIRNPGPNGRPGFFVVLHTVQNTTPNQYFVPTRTQSEFNSFYSARDRLGFSFFGTWLPQCGDGIDNDGDGYIDVAERTGPYGHRLPGDPDCQGDTNRDYEGPALPPIIIQPPLSFTSNTNYVDFGSGSLVNVGNLAGFHRDRHSSSVWNSWEPIPGHRYTPGFIMPAGYRRVVVQVSDFQLWDGGIADYKGGKRLRVKIGEYNHECASEKQVGIGITGDTLTCSILVSPALVLPETVNVYLEYNRIGSLQCGYAGCIDTQYTRMDDQFTQIRYGFSTD